MNHSKHTSDVAIAWNPPVGSGLRSVDYYRVTILPIPPSHPVAFNLINSSSMIVAVEYNVEYRVTILGANCAAQSRPLSIPRLHIGNLINSLSRIVDVLHIVKLLDWSYYNAMLMP